MLQDSNYAVFDYSDERFCKTVAPLITHGFVLIGERDGRVVGAMLGDVHTPFFATNRMGIELALYIEPEFRSGLMASRMIVRWLRWCKEQGAIQCRAGTTTGDVRVHRLYQAMGMQPCGAAFCVNF